MEILDRVSTKGRDRRVSPPFFPLTQCAQRMFHAPLGHYNEMFAYNLQAIHPHPHPDREDRHGLNGDGSEIEGVGMCVVDPDASPPRSSKYGECGVCRDGWSELSIGRVTPFASGSKRSERSRVSVFHQKRSKFLSVRNMIGNLDDERHCPSLAEQ